MTNHDGYQVIGPVIGGIIVSPGPVPSETHIQ